jgi:putative hemolysin
MRTLAWYGAVLVILLLAAIPPAAAMANPAAVYCTALGYTFSARPDAQGNEVVTCTLPGGQTVGAWQFLLGQAAPEYSYCGKMGYTTRIVNDSKACELFNRKSCAACVFPNGSSMEVTQAMGLDFREKVCSGDTCRDPKDYPVTPYLMPPSGGQQPGAVPPWMLFAVVILVIAVIAGLFLLTRKKPEGKTP